MVFRVIADEVFHLVPAYWLRLSRGSTPTQPSRQRVVCWNLCKGALTMHPLIPRLSLLAAATIIVASLINFHVPEPYLVCLPSSPSCLLDWTANMTHRMRSSISLKPNCIAPTPSISGTPNSQRPRDFTCFPIPYRSSLHAVPLSSAPSTPSASRWSCPRSSTTYSFSCTPMSALHQPYRPQRHMQL